MPRSPFALASTAAGPIFVISTALATLYLQLPQAVPVSPANALAVALLALPAVIVGFILSVVPNMVGSSLLLFTGAVFPASRAHPVWIGTGALFGAVIAWSTGAVAEPAYAFGLIFTSACCAAICRRSASWD